MTTPPLSKMAVMSKLSLPAALEGQGEPWGRPPACILQGLNSIGFQVLQRSSAEEELRGALQVSEVSEKEKVSREFVRVFAARPLSYSIDWCPNAGRDDSHGRLCGAGQRDCHAHGHARHRRIGAESEDGRSSRWLEPQGDSSRLADTRGAPHHARRRSLRAQRSAEDCR